MKKSIVVPNVDGHRLYYARLLVDKIMSDGDTAQLLLPASALGSPELATHFRGHDIVDFRPCKDFTMGAILAGAGDSGAERIIIPDGDGYLIPAILTKRRRGIKTALLIMRPRSQRPRGDWLSVPESMVKRALRWLARARGIDVFTLEFGGRFMAAGAPARSVPDPVEIVEVRDTELAERIYGSGGVWFSILGAIDSRKNIELVARALARLRKRTGVDVRLLVAGRVAPEMSEPLRSAGEALDAGAGEIVIHDGLLTDQELDGLIERADCIVAAHSNEGSSGIVGKALALGTRVVGGGAESLRLDLQGISGSVWTVLSEEALADAFSAVLEAPKPVRFRMDSSAFAERLAGTTPTIECAVSRNEVGRR